MARYFGHAAAAFHCMNHSKGWMISDHCSTLLAELSAINQALAHVTDSHPPAFLSYTDSQPLKH